MNRFQVGVAATSLENSFEFYFGPRKLRPTPTEIQRAKVGRALAKLEASNQKGR